MTVPHTRSGGRHVLYTSSQLLYHFNDILLLQDALEGNSQRVWTSANAGYVTLGVGSRNEGHKFIRTADQGSRGVVPNANLQRLKYGKACTLVDEAKTTLSSTYAASIPGHRDSTSRPGRTNIMCLRNCKSSRDSSHSTPAKQRSLQQPVSHQM